MFIIIGDKSRATARSSDNLCPNCSNYAAVRYALDDREERICLDNAHFPRRLRGPVATCTSFYDKTKPNKHEMDKIAWTIETSKRTIGFENQVKFIPPSQRNDIRRDD
jgi:hypothetical protein